MQPQLEPDSPKRPADAVARPAPSPLRARVLQAGSLNLFVHVFAQVLRLVSNLLLARLLAPEAFGVMALAIVVQVIVSLLSDIGLRQAVVQSPQGDTPQMLNTAWTLQIARGWVIWLVCSVFAFALPSAITLGWLPGGSVYAAAELPGVIVGMSFAAVIMGFQSTKVFTTERTLNVRKAIAIELMAQVCGLAVMAVFAFWTRSIWSFVAGALSSAALSVLLGHAWLPGPSNRLAWHRDALRELFGYGRWVLLSSVLFVIAANGDRLMLGAWVDAATLGLYSIAFSLAAMVEGAVTRLLSTVAMPALSEVVRNDPSRLRATYFRLRLPIDVAYLGGSGLLCAVGSLLVDLMYDDRYAPAGPMLQVLAISLIFVRFGLAGSAYLALGEPRYLTWIHLVKVVSVLVTLPIGYYGFGIQGVLFAVAVCAAPTLPLIYFYNRRHGLNDWAFELRVLAAWPVGYGLGWLAARVLGQ